MVGVSGPDDVFLLLISPSPVSFIFFFASQALENMTQLCHLRPSTLPSHDLSASDSYGFLSSLLSTVVGSVSGDTGSSTYLWVEI